MILSVSDAFYLSREDILSQHSLFISFIAQPPYHQKRRTKILAGQ